MKTSAEIISQIDAYEDDDFFGVKRSTLIDALPFAEAKPWLKEGVTESDWESGKNRLRTDDDVKAAMLDYMEFAWGKANDCRGLSTGRSLDHMEAWLWLFDTSLYEELVISREENYAYYGKPQLKLVCEVFGWDWRQWDDDRWRNSEDGPYLTADKALPYA
jgi:hypothetical protein